MDTIIRNLEATWARIKLLNEGPQQQIENASFEADTLELHSTIQDILLRGAAAHAAALGETRRESIDVEFLAELDSIVEGIVEAIKAQ